MGERPHHRTTSPPHHSFNSWNFHPTTSPPHHFLISHPCYIPDVRFRTHLLAHQLHQPSCRSQRRGTKRKEESSTRNEMTFPRQDNCLSTPTFRTSRRVGLKSLAPASGQNRPLSICVYLPNKSSNRLDRKTFVALICLRTGALMVIS